MATASQGGELYLTHLRIVRHERHKSLLADVRELKVIPLHNRLRQLGASGGDTLKLLGGEDVDARELALGSSVLADLGLGHVDDLAGTALDLQELTLADRTGLDGSAIGSSGIGRIIVVVSVRHPAKNNLRQDFVPSVQRRPSTNCPLFDETEPL
eukprot:3136496-Rhodomonas_salina.1